MSEVSASIYELVGWGQILSITIQYKPSGDALIKPVLASCSCKTLLPRLFSYLLSLLTFVFYQASQGQGTCVLRAVFTFSEPALFGWNG